MLSRKMCDFCILLCPSSLSLELTKPSILISSSSPETELVGSGSSKYSSQDRVSGSDRQNEIASYVAQHQINKSPGDSGGSTRRCNLARGPINASVPQF